MSDLIFVGQFVASKTGATGLTVTVDVDRYTLSDGSRSALVTGGSATEGRRGLYHYRLASADLSLYQYVATFITADSSVDQQEIAALGLVVPDALTSSREVAGAAASAAGAVLAAIADVPTVAEFEARTLPSADYTVVSDLPAAPDNASIAAILEDTGTTLPTAISEIAPQASVAISATQAEQVADGELAIATHSDFSQSITSDLAADLSTAEVWLAVKHRDSDDDTEALVMLTAADGLTVLAGSAYATGTDGALTVTGSTGDWTVTAELEAVATALLTSYAGRHLVAEVKYRLTGGQVRVLWSGTAAISRGVIHRTV